MAKKKQNIGRRYKKRGEDKTAYVKKKVTQGQKRKVDNVRTAKRKCIRGVLGPLKKLTTFKCDRCGALLFNTDSPSLCCGKDGKTPGSVIELPRVPPELQTLYKTDPEFCRKSRCYNNLFAFSAIGTSGKFTKPPGPSNVILQGRTYHRMLHGTDESGPLRWFLSDSSIPNTDAAAHGLNPDTVKSVRETLARISYFWDKFKRMSDSPSANVRMELTVSANREIAALICEDTSSEPQQRAVVCWKQTHNQPTFIETSNAMYFPLQYVLLYPYGDLGWDLNMKSTQNITLLKYGRQLLMRLESLDYMGPLRQEFTVDLFSALEDQKLSYYKFNQQKITLRKELQNYTEGEEDPGRTFIPASHVHSKRYMQECIADALAIVAKYGRPTYFITVTCNPKWHEILELLKPHQDASDRPDIVARVFKAKLQQIIDDLVKAFGGEKMIYRIHVIEFQKRGLPHAHIAIKMKSEPLTSEEIDKVISAEIPEDNEELKEIVKRHMVHRHVEERCYRQKGNLNLRNAEGQIQHKTCVAFYPKPMNDNTYTDDSGYAHYRRRKLEDQNVVPYNPHLLLKYDCHINVDISYSVKIIFYLYKYFYKGLDYADVKLFGNDEITEYLRVRYISASEATWRIFEYDTTKRLPSVEQYPIHLPDRNYVVYNSKNRSAKVKQLSLLEKYFERPKDLIFDEMTYMEFYTNYTMATSKPKSADVHECIMSDGKKYFIYLRKTIHVPRLALARPQAGDVWYFRLLLKHISGRSFEDFRTVQNETYGTFAEAATKLGLYNDGTESQLCMEEAIAQFCSPSQLRTLFFLLTIEGAPAVPLFENFQNQMAEDYRVMSKLSEWEAYKRLLSDLFAKFEAAGRGMEEFGLPTPQSESTMLEREAARYDPEACNQIHQVLLEKLNAQQKKVYDDAKSKVDKGEGGLFYINGPAGTGKTFLINCIVNYARSLKKVAICCASTAIAASNYEGGRTAHSTFQIPVENDESNRKLECNVPIKSQRAELLKTAAVIIWDEFVMCHKKNFHAVNEILQKVRQSKEMCGGLLFIASGDFRQIPPVIQYGTKEQIINASIKTSKLWKEFTTFSLSVPMRQQSDPDYAKLLDSIGDGTLSEDNEGLVQLPQYLNCTSSLEQAKDFVYPNRKTRNGPSSDAAILSLRNYQVDKLNDNIYNDLPGEEGKLYSVDELADDTSGYYEDIVNEDFLNALNENNVPPHVLNVKEGIECFLLRNFSPEDGLLNNSKITILKFTKNVITAKVAATGKTVFIPRIIFKIKIQKKNFEMKRRQFPIRPCYARTFNRSQGATLSRCVLDLRDEPFTHGQLYVGLSRVRHRNDILILLTEEQLNSSNKLKTRNIVFNELLLS